jgi:hypothetical protein
VALADLAPAGRVDLGLVARAVRARVVPVGPETQGDPVVPVGMNRAAVVMVADTAVTALVDLADTVRAGRVGPASPVDPVDRVGPASPEDPVDRVGPADRATADTSLVGMIPAGRGSRVGMMILEAGRVGMIRAEPVIPEATTVDRAPMGRMPAPPPPMQADRLTPAEDPHRMQGDRLTPADHPTPVDRWDPLTPAVVLTHREARTPAAATPVAVIPAAVIPVAVIPVAATRVAATRGAAATRPAERREGAHRTTAVQSVVNRWRRFVRDVGHIV